jgi:Uma2 family endonuclease
MGRVRDVVPAYVTDGVYYPASDGKPVGETPPHVKNLLYVSYLLQGWLKNDPNAFAAGDMFVYYEEGDPRKHVSPDVFAVRGVRPDDPPRHRYLMWKEGKGPDFVLEVTSKSTRKKDTGRKFELYRDVLKVSEYFLFDPLGDFLKPPLQGYCLVQGEYVPIEPEKGRLPSRVLGLHLLADGQWVRLVNPATGKWLLNPEELDVAYDRAQTEKERSERERLRAEQEWQKAEKARDEAEAGRQRTEEQLRQSDEQRLQAEREVERLRKELEELRRRLPPS